MRRAAAFLVMVLVSATCASPPAAPTPPASPPGTSLIPIPDSPRAVLAIRSDVDPTLGVVEFTPFVFDASASIGTGLEYFVEYGDGETSTEGVSTHVSGVAAKARSGKRQTARLTVTDPYGRSSTTTMDYFLAAVWTVDYWYSLECRCDFSLRQTGSELSGMYHGRENTAGPGTRLHGTLTDQRTLHLRTEDGLIEMNGSVEWRRGLPVHLDQWSVRLRLTMRGGVNDGRTLDFQWADRY